MTKFYIFRRNTLINKKKQLINEQQFSFILSAISLTSPWAVVASGTTNADKDAACSRVCSKLSLPKSNYYVQMIGGLEGLKSCLYEVEYSKFKNLKQTVLDKQQIAEAALDIALQQPTLEFLPNNNGFQCSSPHSGLEFTMKMNALVKFKLGNTILTMSLLGLRQNRDKLLYRGKFKLFCILSALDKAGYKLDLMRCPGLIKLGIVAIDSPKNHTVIDSRDIVVCHDKKDCISFLKEAGFATIYADIEGPTGTDKAKVYNTYLNTLAESALTPKAIRLTLKHQLINGIQKGDFKTGYLGLTGKTINIQDEGGKIIKAKVPHHIHSILGLLQTTRPGSDSAIIAKSIELARQALKQRPESTWFFHRPLAAQSLYKAILNFERYLLLPTQVNLTATAAITVR
ncbi:hypothetical protein ACFORL_09500 [Legionella dresdenensis]|uniref:Uncharacterized protein n=1 Tax=Legionella dresdenensis TaxID=450200 RepID=A0ABV8CG32_9GAMM